MKYLIVALGFLGLHFYVYYFLATQEIHPERKEFRMFPMAIADWECTNPERMDAKTEKNLGVSDYLICTYRNSKTKQEVGIYLGYHPVYS